MGGDLQSEICNDTFTASLLRFRRIRLGSALFILLVARMLFINGILPGWPLHLDRNLERGLVDIVVGAESLKTRSQHLHPQFTVGRAIEAGLAFPKIGRASCR